MTNPVCCRCKKRKAVAYIDIADQLFFTEVPEGWYCAQCEHEVLTEYYWASKAPQLEVGQKEEIADG